MSTNSNNVKTVKKGDFIIREGDKISSVIMLQSGSATLCVARPKKNIDLFAVGPSQVMGEQAFIGNQTHTFSLMATSEAKYMEIPADLARAQMDAAPQFIKLLIKSLVERLKAALSEVKSSKLEKDSSPCPEDQVAKVFGAIYHAASHKAKSEDPKKPHVLSMEWVPFKQYCQRVFGESPRRLEQACNILVKLKMANYEMGKPIDDPEGADEIQKVSFSDLNAVEAFFEFYQHYYFKGGAANIIKFDESSFNLLSNLLKISHNLEADRRGIVELDFPVAVERFKAEFGINLNSNHFVQLENKGIFAKRQARADGNIFLSFELKDWQMTQKIWRMLKEIEKWNEKGFVSLLDDDTGTKKKTDAVACTSCGVEVALSAKFCHECGAKLEMTSGKVA